jgi:hypothetical protein
MSLYNLNIHILSQIVKPFFGKKELGSCLLLGSGSSFLRKQVYFKQACCFHFESLTWPSSNPKGEGEGITCCKTPEKTLLEEKGK